MLLSIEMEEQFPGNVISNTISHKTSTKNSFCRYRKFNLFGEIYYNTTETADISIFETDFDVRFGMFTCFDILFPNPALRLVKDEQIKHFIFPHRWMSEVPFLTGKITSTLSCCQITFCTYFEKNPLEFLMALV